MDSRYFTSSETHRVIIDDESWIDIKRHMSVADQDTITQRTTGEATIHGGSRAERRRAQKEGKGVASLTFKPSTLVTLEIAIVAWSFDAPVNVENISKLQPWVANKVLEAIDDLNPLERSTQTPTEIS